MVEVIQLRSIAEEFGINVRNARKKQGFTQQDLAEKADIERQTVNLIENGKANPRLLTIYFLAKALNLEVKLLFNFDNEDLEENLNV